MWDAAKAVIKEKCIELKVCSVRKKVMSWIHHLNFYLMKLEKEEQIVLIASRKEGHNNNKSKNE